MNMNEKKKKVSLRLWILAEGSFALSIVNENEKEEMENFKWSNLDFDDPKVLDDPSGMSIGSMGVVATNSA